MIFIGCAAAGFTHWLAIVIATLFLLKSWQFVVGRMEPRLIGRHVSRYVLFAVWVLLSALAAQRIAHLSVFMLDVVATDYALEPPSREMNDPDMAKPFFVKHNCFTCYIVAAELARQGVDNIYDPARYRNAEETTVIHETIGDALHIDRYQ